ncbi:MAG: methyltransferase domain-containing protein [Acidimicrobiales bacterium]
MTADAWKPEQYDRFAAERRLPFDELVGLCQPLADGGVIYDLGCGPGTLTAELGARLGATEVIGVDSSDAMLAKARPLAEGRSDLRFEKGDLASFGDHPLPHPPGLIFSNAALHWVDHHHEVIAQWRWALEHGGQLAIQIPTNQDHPAYGLATRVAEDHPEWFPEGPPLLPSDTVLAPEHYAQILHGLGAVDQYVALRVFTHELPGTADVVEWLKSTTLNPFRLALDALDRAEVAADSEDAERPDIPGETTRFDQFCQAYRDQLISQEGIRHPYLFTFKRILMWAHF